jgi:hypothetical protein
MQTHKFKIGETVFIKPAPTQNLPGGSYVVIQRLPEHDAELEYRVRNRVEPHERVMRESELRATTGDRAPSTGTNLLGEAREIRRQDRRRDNDRPVRRGIRHG